METILQELKSNLTITFSGHNIKDYLILAIESFLHFYPDFKDNILVFDDESNDGTQEWLEENNIKWITWNKYSTNKQLRYDNVCYQYSLMYREIINNVKTKYVLINDGDLFFLKSGFLEDYYNQVDTYKLICVLDTYTEDILKDDIDESLKKYRVLFNIESKYKQNQKLNFVKIFPYHLFCDLDFLKSKNIEFDTIDEPLYYNNYGRYFDNGHDFLYQIVTNNIKFVENPRVNEYTYHIGHISSVLFGVNDSLLDDFDKYQFLIGNVNVNRVNFQKQFINSNSIAQSIIAKYNLNILDLNLKLIQKKISIKFNFDTVIYPSNYQIILINLFKCFGHKIIIQTSRSISEQKQIEAWLKHYDINYDELCFINYEADFNVNEFDVEKIKNEFLNVLGGKLK
jgi:hypothetical protein